MTSASQLGLNRVIRMATDLNHILGVLQKAKSVAAICPKQKNSFRYTEKSTSFLRPWTDMQVLLKKLKSTESIRNDVTIENGLFCSIDWLRGSQDGHEKAFKLHTKRWMLQKGSATQKLGSRCFIHYIDALAKTIGKCTGGEILGKKGQEMFRVDKQ